MRDLWILYGLYMGSMGIWIRLEFIPYGNQTWLAGKYPINGGFNRKITDTWSIFQPAMFDYRRVEVRGLPG